MIRDRINLLFNGKRSNVLKAELSAGLSQTDISGREPHQLTRLVRGSRPSVSISKVLLTIHGLLEMLVGLVPNPLTILEPGVDSKDFRGLT